jgi:uncharacterized protein YjlB
MERRRFNAMLGAAGFGLAGASGSSGGASPEIVRLERNGWVPNNELLPVVLYRAALRADGDDPAAVFEERLGKNGWPAQWRDGVYDFHHYHSTAHEVLGFARGHARLILGGEGGHQVEVRAGDIAVLPTGTGHCKVEASSDFLVVGAYPPDQQWDICRSTPSAEAASRMRRLPFPQSDPVEGQNGILLRFWRSVR